LEWVEARVPNYEDLKKFYRNTLGLPSNFEEEGKDFIQFKMPRSHLISSFSSVSLSKPWFLLI